MPDLSRRKLPRQARSQATHAAILEACARILATRGYSTLTTNRVAQRAGVGIGTLYEFFPNRESIVLALAEERLARLLGKVEATIDASAALAVKASATFATESPLEFLLRRIVDSVAEDCALYRVLLHDATFVMEQPAIRRTLARVLVVGRAGSERMRERIDLPDLEVDVRLIVRMLGHAILDVSCDEPGEPRERALRALLRLTGRMLHAREPSTEPPSRPRSDGAGDTAEPTPAKGAGRAHQQPHRAADRRAPDAPRRSLPSGR